MSTTTTTGRRAEDTAQAAPEAEGGGRKKLVAGAVVAVVALAAAWFLLLGPGSGGKADEEHAAPVPGPVLPLEPMTMNLADGRLLKVGLALQLPEAGGGHGGGEVDGSIALDEAIGFLGTFGYEQLVVPAEREKVKAQLSARLAERYHGEVLSVYFTQFVMQ